MIIMIFMYLLTSLQNKCCSNCAHTHLDLCGQLRCGFGSDAGHFSWGGHGGVGLQNPTVLSHKKKSGPLWKQSPHKLGQLVWGEV